MLDFLRISTRIGKRGVTEIYPKFIIRKSSDLMIRGGDFYAIWVEERGLWSTEEQDAIDLIDAELDKFVRENKDKYDANIQVLHLWDSETKMIDRWHDYCKKQMRDSFNPLDETLIFANDKTDKKAYASKRLPYPLEPGDTPGYDMLMSTLYSKEERHKIEWAIGSIVSGDSKRIQKFMVLYGAAGTGKSTILNIIQQLFEGYYSVFDAKALGSASSSFALEAFKKNPLVAIQHDGDLSRIEDNTRLNSLVSHELMTVNEKFKSQYENRFKCFLFMGTNRPVRITDGRSGLIRRLIDVSPSGNKLGARDYKKAVKQVEFELGAIASHCLEVYKSNPGAYDDYIPKSMLGASNDFYNYVMESYHIFKKDDGTTLKAAWAMYNTYCEEAKVTYPLSQRNFKEELKNYFWDYSERFQTEDGSRLRSYYSGFRTDKFEQESENKIEKNPDGKNDKNSSHWLNFAEGIPSIFDKNCANSPAQYANESGIPMKKWERVKTTLSELDTSKLHFVKVPENHIVIDFDIKGPDGNKSYDLNLEEANKWPPTYAELSKSGGGIHLHYIYSGDPSKLSRIYDENIEIKRFTGDSSLRRKLTKCNDLAIATISSGLPLKGEKAVINTGVVTTEKGLRTTIKRSLNKEIHGNTRCEIDWIFKILEDAYADGIKYDVSDMKNDIFAFAAHSTNQSEYCIKKVNEMHFKSDEPSDSIEGTDDIPIVFYDVEVFSNLFVVCWKYAGENKPIVKMINPKPSDIEELLRYRLIGFNNRKYDNHILYGSLMGYSTEKLYELSNKIINEKRGFFGEAYNLSYTDIYDFASAANKMSLKKLEIQMGIHHDELGVPWDKPAPKELWDRIAEYCGNDVLATEAAFNYLKGDWIARCILADITGLTRNDTTNTLSLRAIFGNNKKPQGEFNYRNLALPVGSDQYDEYRQKFGTDYIFRVFNENGLPEYRDYIPGEVLPDGWSILPFFKGYTFSYGKSIYMDEEIGEGGRVYSEPGIYGNVWDADVTGQHPSSIIAEVLFGPRYTKAFKDIVDGRVNIKHKAWSELDHLFDGKLKPYIQKVIDGELSTKELANALKTVVNSIYGLTSASFENQCRDPRNKDNIVAKRGALFMTLLKSEVQKRGYTVAHIKTDSIKIPDADDAIREFVLAFGKEFGYLFETEAEFEKFCLVNDAVYIAKFKEPEVDKNTGKETWWTATGVQFAVPYVFKTLFSKEPIEFNDLCETFAVSKGDLYLDMNENLPDVTSYELVKSVREDIANGKANKRTKKDLNFCEEWKHISDEELNAEIEKGHNMKFVGRVGQFCPIKPGNNGGVLYRVHEGKNYAAPGSKGYRWLESETVKILKQEDLIDISFYRKLVDDAVDTISKYGDFEWFVSNDPYISDDKTPKLRDMPWYPACHGDTGRTTCIGCPNLNHTQYDIDCKEGYDVGDMRVFNEDFNAFAVR